MELGCGGTIARWAEEGSAVFTVAFSTAEASLPPGSAPDRLAGECDLALDELGVPRENRTVHGFPVRHFGTHRQELLEHLVRLNREIEPDVVLVPSGADVHQDHGVVHAEALRAFKHLTLLGYEATWNTIAFPAEAFVVLDERHVDRKWAALSRYVSQVELGRSYFTEEYIRSLATVRGVQVKARFAEAFEAIRVRI